MIDHRARGRGGEGGDGGEGEEGEEGGEGAVSTWMTPPSQRERERERNRLATPTPPTTKSHGQLLCSALPLASIVADILLENHDPSRTHPKVAHLARIHEREERKRVARRGCRER